MVLWNIFLPHSSSVFYSSARSEDGVLPFRFRVFLLQKKSFEAEEETVFWKRVSVVIAFAIWQSFAPKAMWCCDEYKTMYARMGERKKEKKNVFQGLQVVG
ncbi:hypothetical protein CDAR_497871 [Caerostris darwini]|uniref:Uncharacterized protein n=1 Tax=Caerostris darwini TaxID=1538125 RepID=A0AAV4TC92_9ARAC|nr:hypothetical protein CDAR_497871 [Caerostris darwini]